MSSDLLNLYEVTQLFDDGEEVWHTHTACVRAKDEGDARRIVAEDDREEPRRFGWKDAAVKLIGWATGERQPQGVIGYEPCLV